MRALIVFIMCKFVVFVMMFQACRAMWQIDEMSGFVKVVIQSEREVVETGCETL